jgi:protein SCO1/2
MTISKSLSVAGLSAALLAAEAAAGESPAADHCAQAAKPSPFRRSEARYELPDVPLRDQAGRPFALRELSAAPGPVAVNFIFTTCTTICPVMSATFAQMRRELGKDAAGVRMVSISIDPEHDTPDVLARYAERCDAPPEWTFLTGGPGDIERVLRAFDVWTPTKTSHRPVTLVLRPERPEWVRLEGLGSGTALAAEVRTLLD